MHTPWWLKHLCSIRAWVPVSFFLSILSVFLYLWLIPWSAEARWAHFLARASKTLSRRRTVPSPTREGARCLRAAAWALRTGWLSAETRGYQPLSLSYFLIIDSGPPGSSPLKDQHSGSSSFSKPSLDIWKFLACIIPKSSMQDFKHCLTNMGDQCNCQMVSTFFSTTHSLVPP